jgi:uncharacterized C2H2 Zn-finger protein
VKQLQDRVARAEQSGIRQLDEFSQCPRCYAVLKAQGEATKNPLD